MTKRQKQSKPNPVFSDDLKPKVAASILGVSPATLVWWRKEKKGPRYREYRERVWYPMNMLLKWAKDQQLISEQNFIEIEERADLYRKQKARK